MAVVNPIIFQVVGYQNSGKTTFMTKIIEILSKEKWSVATIKHHGHGGQPDVVKDKDTSRHIEAGAMCSVAEGNGRLILHAEQSCFDLSRQIQLVSSLHPDLILVEGHKRSEFPKVVLLRDQLEDYKLVEDVNNIKVVFNWSQVLPNNVPEVPCFHINDEKGLQWLIDYLKNQRQSNKDMTKRRQ